MFQDYVCMEVLYEKRHPWAFIKGQEKTEYKAPLTTFFTVTDTDRI